MVERIPIDNDRAMQREPIHVTTQLKSFPERFAIRLDWNHIQEKWVLEIEHLAINRRVVKGFASPYTPYWYGPYVVFSLLDLSGRSVEVTPENLGDDVQLFAFPGPSGVPVGEQ